MYFASCFFVLNAVLFGVTLALPVGCGGPLLNSGALLSGGSIASAPSVITGNIMTNVGPIGAPITNPQTSPLITEIVPALQFGDINLAGDLPVGGTIKICGTFPVYGTVAVDGVVPSYGTAVVNTGEGLVTQVIEPCKCF